MSVLAEIISAWIIGWGIGTIRARRQQLSAESAQRNAAAARRWPDGVKVGDTAFERRTFERRHSATNFEDWMAAEDARDEERARRERAGK